MCVGIGHGNTHFDSYIHGHHISKDFRILLSNEELVCGQESGNSQIRMIIQSLICFLDLGL